MREKELRFGVVLTGGVSLALYMHGVAKELHKLARASRAFHTRDATGAIPDRYGDKARPGSREIDTEEIYFDLLKALSPELDLRVIIDVIAGSSAGGVNGVMLARALAHDYNLESHRDLWLKFADVLHLIDPDASAGRWGKLYIAPIVTMLLRRRRLKQLAPEPETRFKLLQFLRSRWFQPPFSGRRFAAWMLDASIAMEDGAPHNSTLMPEGHPLDLFISVTDFYGHANQMALHDPPEIRERDHRHVLHYRYHKPPGQAAQSDFTTAETPGLVFAARATSCFPGAFPPASLQELDALLEQRKREWPGRQRFIEQKLGDKLLGGRNPATVRFIDGSVVNDKPFAAAISAIGSRPAHREVTRRLIYVEPVPGNWDTKEESEEPGFLRTILASLAEIPRIEPIRDELVRIEQFNRHIRLVSQVLRRTRPLIVPFVDEILRDGESMGGAPTQDAIGQWRHEANEAAARHAGYAFHSYFRLKIMSVSNRLRRLTSQLAWPHGVAGLTAELREGYYQALTGMGLGDVTPDPDPDISADPSEGEIAFLRAFDVDFRVRRLRFVIRRLNELYTQAGRHGGLHAGTELLDELKTTLYATLNDVKQRWDAAFYDPRLGLDLASGTQQPAAAPGAFTQAIEQISRAMDLVAVDKTIDEIFSVMVLNYMPAELRRDLFTAYIGFSFFDVMSFPMVQWEDLDEFEEILIDRVSPQDADAIRSNAQSPMLKGTLLRNFGGFFNRSYRENDYLWGRLNAADRLVDIVLGAVRDVDAARAIDASAVKHRLFNAILDAEEPHLRADETLVAQIRAEIAAVAARAGSMS